MEQFLLHDCVPASIAAQYPLRHEENIILQSSLPTTYEVLGSCISYSIFGPSSRDFGPTVASRTPSGMAGSVVRRGSKL